MRILAVSNLYPPHVIGGYEIGCRDVMERLRERGHEVTVLTSTYGIVGPRVDGHVHRELLMHLNLPDDPTGYLRRLLEIEKHNSVVFRALLNECRPEVLYCWNLLALSHRCFWARPLKVPTAQYVFDHNLAFWRGADPWWNYWHHPAGGTLRKTLKSVLSAWLRATGTDTEYGPPPLLRCQFASSFLKQQALCAGLAVAEAPVVPFGLDLQQFPFRHETRSKPTRLLFVGRLIPDKGLHLAVEAMSALVHEHRREEVSLTVVGNWGDADYEARVDALITRHNLEKHVTFAGQVPRADLWRVLHEHDVFVFPSCWDEPFGLALLEAMACGLAVVSTATGGSAEIIEPGRSGLVAPLNDAKGFANVLLQALEPHRNEALRRAARQRVEDSFQLSHTVDVLERDLQALRDGSAALRE